jgi:hypothetical protein
LPARNDRAGFVAHRVPRAVSVHAAGKQAVIRRVAMADVRAHRKLHRLRIELLGCRRAAHPAGIFLASMIRDSLPLRGRAAGKLIGQPLRKLLHVALVDLGPPHRRALAGACPRRVVGEAFTLGLLQRGFLDQEALALVAPPRATEFDHDG